MLGRLVLKMLFKACVPLVAVVGVMSYGMYMKGGDPSLIFKHVASGAVDKVSGMFAQTTEHASGLVGQVASTVGEPSRHSDRDQVFTWKDADGVTHFGSVAPDGSNAQTLNIDPNANVVAPVYERIRVSQDNSADVEASADTIRRVEDPWGTPGDSRGARSSERDRNRQAMEDLEAQLGGPLPGVAGQILSNGGGESGFDATQLIKILQSVE